MISFVKDKDLFENLDGYDAILVGTNIYCSMGQGLQLKVMLNYPYVFNKNLETKYADPRKVGTILECKEDGEPTFCICFITKGYNFRPDIISDYLEYEGLEKCLKLVNILYKGKKIASPLLGVSKFEGNGDREKILEIFNRTIKDVDLTIYDYYQKSRDEETLEVMRKELAVRDVDKQEYSRMVKERHRKAEERFRKNGHRRY